MLLNNAASKAWPALPLPPHFPDPVSALHKALYSQKTWKRKKTKFFHHLSSLHQQKGEGRIMCVLNTQGRARPWQFGLKCHKVPPVCSNVGWSPWTIKTPHFITGTATGTGCTVPWQQLRQLLSQVAKGAVGKRCDRNSRAQTELPQQDARGHSRACNNPTTLLAALVNVSTSRCHAPDGKLVGFRISSPGKQREASQSKKAQLPNPRLVLTWEF